MMARQIVRLLLHKHAATADCADDESPWPLLAQFFTYSFDKYHIFLGRLLVTSSLRLRVGELRQLRRQLLHWLAALGHWVLPLLHCRPVWVCLGRVMITHGDP